MSLNVPNINLTKREKLILEIFSKKNNSTAKEISFELGVVEKTIKRDIASLKEKTCLNALVAKMAVIGKLLKDEKLIPRKIQLYYMKQENRNDSAEST